MKKKLLISSKMLMPDKIDENALLKNEKYKLFVENFDQIAKNINETTDNFLIRNNMCCSSCGHSEIELECMEKCPNTLKALYAFYHFQIRDNIFEQITNNHNPISFHLHHGCFVNSKKSNSNLKSFVNLLNSFGGHLGFRFAHDGNINNNIIVLYNYVE